MHAESCKPAPWDSRPGGAGQCFLLDPSTDVRPAMLGSRRGPEVGMMAGQWGSGAQHIVAWWQEHAMVLKVSHGRPRRARTHMVKTDTEIMCVSQKTWKEFPATSAPWGCSRKCIELHGSVDNSFLCSPSLLQPRLTNPHTWLEERLWQCHRAASTLCVSHPTSQNTWLIFLHPQNRSDRTTRHHC